MTNYTGAKKLIADFIGDDVIRFYTSSQDGKTECVEYRSFGRIKSTTVAALGRSIMRHKRALAEGRVF
jgi:hypothetical protein